MLRTAKEQAALARRLAAVTRRRRKVLQATSSRPRTQTIVAALKRVGLNASQ